MADFKPIRAEICRSGIGWRVWTNDLLGPNHGCGWFLRKSRAQDLANYMNFLTWTPSPA